MINNTSSIIENFSKNSQPFLIIASSLEQRLALEQEIIDSFKVSASDQLRFDPDDGVEVLRAQIAKLSMKPHSSEFRIFIVDRAESLNIEQANTLLKTLEEPPGFARILIFTSSLAKILPTIKSRCYKFIFSQKKVYDRESIITYLENYKFREYVKFIKDLDAPSASALLQGGIEESKRKGLNRAEARNIEKMAKILIDISSTNSSFKLALESLYLSYKSTKSK